MRITSTCLSLLITAVLFANTAGAGASSILPEEGKGMARRLDVYTVIDVRTPEEYSEQHYPGSMNIPVQELADRAAEITAEKPVLLYCKKGIRAKRAYTLVRELRPDITTILYIDGMPLF